MLIPTTLIADIGGTNIRFALIKKGEATLFKLYPHDKGLTAEKAIKTYLDEVKAKPKQLIIGAAGPLLAKGKIKLTNRKFVLDLPKLCKTFGFKRGLLANDMVLHALGVAHLPDTNNACVVYVGTGIGCAYIKNGVIEPSEDGRLPIFEPSETERTMGAKIWEDMISGPAFLRIYKSLSGPQKPVLQSREVSYLAHHGKDQTALQTYRIIATTLGRFCRQIATQKKVSVFYLGGKIMEVLRMPEAQDEFFKTLGRLGDIISFRQIRPEMHTAITGLKVLEEDLRTDGTTHHVTPGHFYVWPEK